MEQNTFDCLWTYRKHSWLREVPQLVVLGYLVSPQPALFLIIFSIFIIFFSTYSWAMMEIWCSAGYRTLGSMDLWSDPVGLHFFFLLFKVKLSVDLGYLRHFWKDKNSEILILLTSETGTTKAYGCLRSKFITAPVKLDCIRNWVTRSTSMENQEDRALALLKRVGVLSLTSVGLGFYIMLLFPLSHTTRARGYRTEITNDAFELIHRSISPCNWFFKVYAWESIWT